MENPAETPHVFISQARSDASDLAEDLVTGLYLAGFATYLDLAVTLNSAPRHARNRQGITLQIGTASRSKPAPDHAAIRHLLRRGRGHPAQRVSTGETSLC